MEEVGQGGACCGVLTLVEMDQFLAVAWLAHGGPGGLRAAETTLIAQHLISARPRRPLRGYEWPNPQQHPRQRGASGSAGLGRLGAPCL